MDYVVDFDEFLGKGAHSRVYGASHSGQSIAAKVIHLNGSDSFDNEVSVYKYIQSKYPEGLECLCYFYTAGTIKFKAELHGVLFLEKLEGETLEEFISTRGCLPARDARMIFKKIVKAVSVLHNIGVALCDIKAENIYIKKVGKRFHVRLFDLGLSTTNNWEGWDSKYVGTPIYMAPEVLKVSQNTNCLKADMWSLGVLYHLLLTGELLFAECRNKAELLAAAYNVKVTLSKRYNGNVCSILRGLLDPQPEHRMTAVELEAALRDDDPRLTSIPLPFSILMRPHFSLSRSCPAPPSKGKSKKK